MTTAQPDPLAFGGNRDPGPNLAAPAPTAEAQTAPKRLLNRLWKAADGGPGPAEWRKHKGNIQGVARRKGEKNPMKYGVAVNASILGHHKMKNTEKLPPRKTPKEPKESKEGKKCEMM